MLSPLADTLLGIAEIGGNRLLSMDQQVIDRCQKLQGHCIEIHITDLDFKVFCHPGSWGLRLARAAPTRR